MNKIADLSHLFQYENLHNWCLSKYVFAFTVCFLSVLRLKTFMNKGQGKNTKKIICSCKILIWMFLFFFEYEVNLFAWRTFHLIQSLLSSILTSNIKDRSAEAIRSRASPTDALFFKSIRPHSRQSHFETRLISLSIHAGNDLINLLLIHFQLSGY